MQNIVNYCNANSGFISMILSIITIILSIAAIFVSVRAAMLPYKKELRFYTLLMYDKNGDYTLDLFLFNSGNCPLYIKSIEVCQNPSLEPLALAALSWNVPTEDRIIASQSAHKYHFSLSNCNAADNHENSCIEITIDAETKQFKHQINWAVG